MDHDYFHVENREELQVQDQFACGSSALDSVALADCYDAEELLETDYPSRRTIDLEACEHGLDRFANFARVVSGPCFEIEAAVVQLDDGQQFAPAPCHVAN